MMHFTLISPPEPFPREAKLLNDMFSNGLETFHLRKPEMSFLKYRNLLEAVDPSFRNRVVIHSHHSLAQSFKLKGIHYTEKSRPEMLHSVKDCTISTSFHELQQLKKLSNNYQSMIDYAFLSPVYDSISKRDYQSAQFDILELKAVLKSTPFPIFALGGVEIEKIEELAELGFRGAAVIGSVWNATNPIESMKALLRKCESMEGSSS